MLVRRCDSETQEIHLILDDWAAARLELYLFRDSISKESTAFYNSLLQGLRQFLTIKNSFETWKLIGIYVNNVNYAKLSTT